MPDMPDWTRSMKQTFEYYKVDPISWRDTDEIKVVKSSEIDWDSDTDTLLSATLDITGEMDECYIRIYLIATQDRIEYRIPLATCLVQTPATKYNGRYKSQTLDAYSPLTELKETYPPFGYSVLKGNVIMPLASQLCAENLRAPVIPSIDDKLLETDFVSDPQEKWMEFLPSFMANAKFRFGLEPTGEVIFQPVQEIASLREKWTYSDDNSSILYSDLDVERDLYGIPNIIEVFFTQGSYHLHTRVINNDPNSPVSTVSRGREIVYRETDPDVFGIPNQQQLNDYALERLRNLSSLEYTVTYSHGYCPVRIGDCVLLNYQRAGLSNIKALVKSQHITCRPGCKVDEMAVFTTEVGTKFVVDLDD